MLEFKSKYSNYRHILSQKKRSEIHGVFKLPNENLPNPEEKCESTLKKKIKPCQTAKTDSSNANKKDNKKEQDSDSFEFRGVCFKALDDGKIKCGLCQMEISRLIVHMNGNPGCAKDFDMGDFRTEYSNYRNRQRQKKNSSKQQNLDPEGFRESVNKRKKKQEEKQKAENPKGFRDDVNKRKKNQEEKQKAEDPKGFRDSVNKRKKHQEEKQMAEDPMSFRDNLNKRVRKTEEKQKAEDPKGFRDNVNKRKKNQEEKQKA